MEYTKLSPIEHILKRPGMYIGSTQESEKQVFIYDSDSIELKKINFNPGLIKLFDEALNNAIDHSLRPLNKKVSKIKIDLNKDFISVYNDGDSIPIEKKNGVYIPQMIFSELLTSSNYNDEEDRYLTGTNGLGIKLVCIYSSEFKINCCDGKNLYSQTITKNNKNISEPEIKKSKTKTEYTEIIFKIDPNYFSITEEALKLMYTKCIFSCLALKKCKLILNGTEYRSIDLKKFTEKYFSKENYYLSNNDWEITVFLSQKEHILLSFVNGNQTIDGGKHVDYIYSTIAKKLNLPLKTIKDNVSLIVNASINKPTFNSQAKEKLVTPIKDFGKCIEINDSFIKKIKKPVTELCKSLLLLKSDKDLIKADGKKQNNIKVSKLEDATFAGTKKSKDCVLYLTEGDSAKTFVISGFSVIGRNNNGVFPLKGKMLNVLQASKKQLVENEEIINIKKILGLKTNVKYTSESIKKELRYGKVRILTDQDTHGQHIIGLILNFFYFFWPELLKLNFIDVMKTPLIKAKLKSGKTFDFYSEKEFQDSKIDFSSVKYYKGLGSSTSKEAQECFKKLTCTTSEFNWTEKCEEALFLAFKKNSNRKNWIGSYNIENPPEIPLQKTIDSFINTELIKFSVYDNHCSIPHLIDGLKPSQRKVMYTCFTKKIDEIKVAQLGASVAEITNYHHGENSLFGTIINLAQNYPGSNNINYLEPLGQFGSRQMCGKDSASPRYIFTKLNNEISNIFLQKDFDSLNYITEENKKIEPLYYFPVVPAILINGSQGIGTGYSTYIPPFNIKDIVSNISLILNDQEPLKLTPWFKNFKGKIVPKGNNFEMICEYLQTEKTIIINEIPIGTSISSYKEFLESIDSVKILKNNSTENEIYFEISFEEDCIEAINSSLKKSISMSNLHCFYNGIIHHFKDPNDIIKIFVKERLDFLSQRKLLEIEKLCKNLFVIENEMDFINLVIEDKIILNKRSKNDIFDQMKKFELKDTENLFKKKFNVFTLEEIEKMKRKKEELETKLSELEKKTIKEIMIDEINLI